MRSISVFIAPLAVMLVTLRVSRTGCKSFVSIQTFSSTKKSNRLSRRSPFFRTELSTISC